MQKLQICLHGGGIPVQLLTFTGKYLPISVIHVSQKVRCLNRNCSCEGIARFIFFVTAQDVSRELLYSSEAQLSDQLT